MSGARGVTVSGILIAQLGLGSRDGMRVEICIVAGILGESVPSQLFELFRIKDRFTVERGAELLGTTGRVDEDDLGVLVMDSFRPG